MHLIQGWSLNPMHPCTHMITPDKIISCTSKACLRDQISYIQTHATKLLTHPTLPTHANSETILQRILSQPYLSTSEDDLLHHLLSYTTNKLSLPDVTHWSSDNIATARPLLRRLLTWLRTDGLGVHSLVRVEEMGLVGEERLLAMYRGKALCQEGGRGRAVIAEGLHPEDGEMCVTEIFVGGHRCLVEFDRRCDVGTWYICLDRGCENVFVEWQGLWRRKRSVRVLMVPAGRFFVVAKGRGWGWKLFAVSVE